MINMEDVNQYIKNYNAFVKEYKNKYKPPISPDKYNEIYNLAESYGLKVGEISGRKVVYSPSQYKDFIENKTITSCKPWESEYYVPKGNWLYDKDGACGKGCLCVDNGADRESLDIINSIPFIEVGQICDGSKEHKPRTNKTPFIAFDYKSRRPINLDALKSLCHSSKQIEINDYGDRTIVDLCTNTIDSVEETQRKRKRQREMYKGQRDAWGKLINKQKIYPSVLILGNRYNDKEFWQDTAKALLNIEGDGENIRKINKNTKRKQITKGFDFGEGFLV